MKKLKIILLSDRFFFLFLFSSVLFCIYMHIEPPKSKLDPSVHEWQAIVHDVSDRGNYVHFIFDVGEIISGNYFKNENESLPDFHIGDKILLRGNLELPSKNTVPNLFNYRAYLKTKGQYYLVEIESIEFLESTDSWFYRLKNKMLEHIEHYQSGNYLLLFLLGDKHGLEDTVVDSYQINGISHLFAISGMHISLLSMILFWLLRKIKVSTVLSTFLVMSFLLFYMVLVDFSPSVVRSTVFFCLLSLNKVFRLGISTIRLFLIMVGIALYFRPFIIYDVGFQYSASISFFLLLYQKHLKKDHYFYNLFIVSTIAFLIGLPISLFHFYQVNFLGIIFNLFFVPFVSFLVFPLTLLTFCLPFLDQLYLFFTQIMETISLYLLRFDFFTIVFGRPSWLWILAYYLFLLLFLFRRKRRFLVLYVILFFVLYFQLWLFPRHFFMIIDVGQGDSILFHSRGKTLLVDTGGKLFSSSSLASNTLIPLFHSLGIRSLDYLILTHGDYDHMGEAIHLINHFPVREVIFNRGTYNDLEVELINVLEEKNIKYYQNVRALDMESYQLLFLNHTVYDDENDNSIVLYTEFYGIKLLLMSDAGVEVENQMIERYNLSDIDVLKVGHHGSKTSTSKKFIREVNPRYSIISVGKNNRYGHPNDSVLDHLRGSTIYRTDLDGSIIFEIKDDELKIETCAS